MRKKRTIQTQKAMRKLNLNQPEQRTYDWHRARLGNWTGSEIHKLMGKGRNKNEKFSETAKSYIIKVLSERMLSAEVVADDELFGLYLDHVGVWSKALEWGIEHEHEAHKLYEKKTGNEVTEVSSVAHADIENYAASPDGLVIAADKVIEIKCPSPETFVRYKLMIADAADLKAVKPEYYWQVMAEMDCTGAAACDFTVYNPFMGDPIHVATIERDNEAIKAIHERIEEAEQYILDLTK